MQKIPTIFKRSESNRAIVIDERNPDCDWVFNGEGTATRKFDGTCCLIRDGKMFKRYEVKKGGKPPADFEPANEIDEATGKQQGWVPVGDGPEDQYHRAAILNMQSILPMFLEDPILTGTYELCGPKVQGNPEGYSIDMLVSHNPQDRVEDFSSEPPRDFDGLWTFLGMHNIEGIVWHHPDGRMAKIKGRDFGINRAAITPRVLSS